MSKLDDLIAKGLIEAVESDRPLAEQWISDARRHLEAAQAIQTNDPSGAYVLAGQHVEVVSPVHGDIG